MSQHPAPAKPPPGIPGVTPATPGDQDSNSKSSITVVNTASFHQPAGTPRPSDPGSKSTPSASSASSSKRFEVRKVLGSGGFGTVSLAWDSTLEREVAIKRPAPQLDEEHKRSFLAEARLAAKIKHPGIVVVHDVGTDESGDPFVVYEFLPGANLKQRMAAKSLSLAESLDLAIQLADALAAAHQLGVTHRDLKPANILLDDQGRPHIADFGLATEHDHQSGLRGQVAGTYRYMSPEQVRGEAHHLDGRTDLWSLGIILYEMLSGKLPFASDENSDLFEQILHREPRPLRQWSKQIPRGLEQVVLRLLAKPVAERYPSASDVADDLRKCLAELQAETVTLMPASAIGATPAQRRSGSYGLVAAGGIGLVLLVAIGWLVINALGGPGWNTLVPSIDVSRDGSASLIASPELDHYSPGVWTNVLLREPRPLIMSASDRRVWSVNDLMVAAVYPAVLQLGQTSEQQFSLRVTMQGDKWDADSGIFLGFGQVSERPQVDQGLLFGVAQDPSGKLKLHVRRVEFQHQGIQLPQFIELLGIGELAGQAAINDRITLQIDVVGGQVDACYLNAQAVPLSDVAALGRLATKGKFGVYVFGKTCRFSSAEIRVSD